MFQENLESFATLERIMAQLRSPQGCPWDKEQTHPTLKTFLLEESYEVLAALDEEDMDKLKEELGDLLMQIVFHAQIAAEAGKFNMGDILEGINAKLIKRHPHVFDETSVASSQEVPHRWEAIKKEEREGSILASVPKQMPALAGSQSIQRRVAEVGFDWASLDEVLDKVREELNELERAKTSQEKIHEWGDLLFALANAARWQKIDPEEALRLANQRFSRRFAYMEEVCRQRGLSLESLSLTEQNALWEQAKEKERL
ncbi:MAG: nucleoside triphosphate pyrophosphohydrolase [Chloroflexi bacterium]|nr:nucleoside triphosphate pyrophosphohydrolase [Chloroflexota bacterium]